jgi:peptidoglycan/xylan/chitin deacetylase (PgdA/CDA1 family)
LTPVFTYPVSGRNGGTSRAAKVDVTSRTNGDAKWTFSAAFVGEQAELTFAHYYTATVSTVVVAEIGHADGSTSYMNLGVLPAASSWTNWSKTFTTPAGTRHVTILHVLAAVGSLTIDDVSLIVGEGTPPPPPATNLMTNPSFETANGVDPLGWNRGGWGPNDRTHSYPVAGRTGAKAVQTKLVNYTDGDTKWYPDITPVTPGVEYTYSDWYKADDISDIIGAYTMSNGQIIYFGVAKELIPTTVWTQASGNFIPPSGVVGVTFMHLISSPATLTIDDASLTVSSGGYRDTEHPAVTLTQPGAGSTVSGSAAVAADAIDNVGVVSVSFYVDGVLLGAPDTTLPYSTSWATEGSSNGTHTLSAVARDAAGLSATSTVIVTVSNSAPPTENLIVNPSLESGDGITPLSWSKGGWGTNNAVFTYPISGGVTPKAAQVAISSYTSGDAKWFFTPAPVLPEQAYLYAHSYRSSVPTSVVARYTLTGGAFSYVTIGTLPAAANWARFTAQIIPPAGVVAVTVFHVLDRIGTLAVDDYTLSSATGQTDPNLFTEGMVSLTFDDGWLSHYTNALPILNSAGLKGSFAIISLETLDALPYNRIANSSFEEIDGSGNPIDWNKGNWGTNNATFTYPVPGQGDTKAARVTMGSYTDGDAKWFFKDSAVVDGADYSISDYYLSDVTTTVTVRYNMGNNVFVYVDVATLPPATTWTSFTRQLTIPANVESFTFFHRLHSAGSLTIDNVNFSKVQIFVSPEQVLALEASGHEIAAHTQTHASLSNIPSAQMQNEIVDSQSDILAMGVTTVDTLVYPYGDYNQAVQSATFDAGYIGARSVDRGFNTRSTDKYALKIQQVGATTTVAEIKGWIDQAVSGKSWLILMFHQVDTFGRELSITPANLSAIAAYLNAAAVPVVTMHEGIMQMN